MLRQNIRENKECEPGKEWNERNDAEWVCESHWLTPTISAKMDNAPTAAMRM
tara:strand:- start:59 stop:214 length:156 start_codon:yes stop_codon:yes gene_type:complete